MPHPETFPLAGKRIQGLAETIAWMKGALKR
jgi:hypothetical protein